MQVSLSSLPSLLLHLRTERHHNSVPGWCTAGWEQQHRASRSAAPKALNSGAAWGPAGGKDNRLSGIHIYS